MGTVSCFAVLPGLLVTTRHVRDAQPESSFEEAANVPIAFFHRALRPESCSSVSWGRAVRFRRRGGCPVRPHYAPSEGAELFATAGSPRSAIFLNPSVSARMDRVTGLRR